MTKPVALLDANVFPLIWLLWLTDSDGEWETRIGRML